MLFWLKTFAETDIFLFGLLLSFWAGWELVELMFVLRARRAGEEWDWLKKYAFVSKCLDKTNLGIKAGIKFLFTESLRPEDYIYIHNPTYCFDRAKLTLPPIFYIKLPVLRTAIHHQFLQPIVQLHRSGQGIVRVISKNLDLLWRNQFNFLFSMSKSLEKPPCNLVLGKDADCDGDCVRCVPFSMDQDWGLFWKSLDLLYAFRRIATLRQALTAALPPFSFPAKPYPFSNFVWSYFSTWFKADFAEFDITLVFEDEKINSRVIDKILELVWPEYTISCGKATVYGPIAMQYLMHNEFPDFRPYYEYIQKTTERIKCDIPWEDWQTRLSFLEHMRRRFLRDEGIVDGDSGPFVQIYSSPSPTKHCIAKIGKSNRAVSHAGLYSIESDGKHITFEVLPEHNLENHIEGKTPAFRFLTRHIEQVQIEASLTEGDDSMVHQRARALTDALNVAEEVLTDALNVGDGEQTDILGEGLEILAQDPDEPIIVVDDSD